MAQRLVLISPLAPAQPVPPDKPGSVPTPHGGAPQPASYFATITYLEPEGPPGGVPTPPIHLPPGVWPTPPDRPGLPGVPTPPIYYPPYPGQGPGFPTHPIAPGGPPPEVWPQPPGRPPGVWPSPPGGSGHPEHPIVLPPDPDAPPGTVWPPLEPPVAESGYIIAWVPGQGYKYVKVALPPEKPSTKPPVPEVPTPRR
jgi:hypothetical protein